MEVKCHYKKIQCVSQEVQITGNLNIPRSIVTMEPFHRNQKEQYTENQDFVSLHTLLPLFLEYGCATGSPRHKERATEQGKGKP